MIKETPQISPQELAVQLNIPLGETMVMLDEIRGQQPFQDSANSDSEKASKTARDRSLLDFDK